MTVRLSVLSDYHQKHYREIPAVMVARPVLFYQNICLNEIKFVIGQFSTFTTPRALVIRKRIGVRCVTKHFYQTTVKKKIKSCLEHKIGTGYFTQIVRLIFRKLVTVDHH